MATKTTKKAKSTKTTKKKPARKKKKTLTEKAAERKAAEKEEVKRQQTELPVSKVTVDDGGSHAIDHLTILDNHEEPDTNLEPAEDIQKRMTNDLSFWGGSWTWNEAERAYGDKPEDKWFINPTPKLLAEVMNNAPLIHGSCETALLVQHKDELDTERKRHLDFYRTAQSAEFVSESLDMLTSYQGRFFEAVQQYLGRSASYDNQNGRDDVPEEQIENARMRKVESAAVCRRWVAKLIALVEAYHSVMDDERAYNLHYNFAPAPDSREFNLYRWSVTTALNKIGRRLARSVKEGKMDAEKYRIPRPWMETVQKSNRKKADELISDFV